ncbi:MAG: radical SAM protein, partial [Clostridia bacterium]|nr:radical SAM protein [Clostridia bacterium]
ISIGVCLTGEMIDLFYRNRDLIDVNFSLDGNEKVHNCLRQGYKMTFAAITEYEKVFGHKPLINATVTRKTIDNADEVISFFVNNGFDRVNFSIVSDIDDPAVKITQAEYEVFLERCGKSGIKMRQKRGGIDRTYDCAKYGRLCGVGHTNIFITKKAIYPCGRFFGRNEYKLGEFDEKLSNIEAKFTRFEPLADGCCYFDTYSGGKKE